MNIGILHEILKRQLDEENNYYEIYPYLIVSDVYSSTDFSESLLDIINDFQTRADDLYNIPPPVTSVNGKTGDVVLNKNDVGLNNVDNTSDLDKPVSIATQNFINKSFTDDFNDEFREMVDNLAAIHNHFRNQNVIENIEYNINYYGTDYIDYSIKAPDIGYDPHMMNKADIGLDDIINIDIREMIHTITSTHNNLDILTTYLHPNIKEKLVYINEKSDELQELIIDFKPGDITSYMIEQALNIHREDPSSHNTIVLKINDLKDTINRLEDGEYCENDESIERTKYRFLSTMAFDDFDTYKDYYPSMAYVDSLSLNVTGFGIQFINHMVSIFPSTSQLYFNYKDTLFQYYDESTGSLSTFKYILLLMLYDDAAQHDISWFQSNYPTLNVFHMYTESINATRIAYWNKSTLYDKLLYNRISYNSDFFYMSGTGVNNYIINTNKYTITNTNDGTVWRYYPDASGYISYVVQTIPVTNGMAFVTSGSRIIYYYLSNTMKIQYYVDMYLYQRNHINNTTSTLSVEAIENIESSFGTLSTLNIDLSGLTVLSFNLDENVVNNKQIDYTLNTTIPSTNITKLIFSIISKYY